MATDGTAFIIGTCDTKFQDLNFVKDLLRENSFEVKLVDVGTTSHDNPVDVSAEEVASYHPDRKDLLLKNQGRGDAVTAMSESLTHFLLDQGHIAGVLGLGGSGGTALITKALQALPVGVPKIMVSTVASGNIEPYIGVTDIMMMYSITDISGINQISHTILSNAAHALMGTISYSRKTFIQEKPALGLTMFGVTTPCINMIQQSMADHYDCLVFHATGTGGRSMEKLVASGFIPHVIDITTTEVADLIAGGIMSAGEERLDAIIKRGLPYVGSTGALDMVNFGHIDTVPEKYKNRLLYKHNEQVTLMRTTVEENILMGKWIAKKLNRMTAPVRFLLPERGVSLMSENGQSFYDTEADQALFETLENSVQQHEQRQLLRLPFAINDPGFAIKVKEAFNEINLK